MALERTLVILKPDALNRRLTAKIVNRFLESGLRVVASCVLMATDKHLDGQFPVTEKWVLDIGTRARIRVRNEMGTDPTAYFGTADPFETGMRIIRGCREYYQSGPLMPLVLEGEDAVKKVRALIGNTLPSKAAPGTIRGDFGIPEDLKLLQGGAAQNLVHASDSVLEAEREIAVWFSSEQCKIG